MAVFLICHSSRFFSLFNRMISGCFVYVGRIQAGSCAIRITDDVGFTRFRCVHKHCTNVCAAVSGTYVCIETKSCY